MDAKKATLEASSFASKDESLGDLDINMRILQISFVFNNDLELIMERAYLMKRVWLITFPNNRFFARKRKLKLNEHCCNISFHSGNEKFLI